MVLESYDDRMLHFAFVKFAFFFFFFGVGALLNFYIRFLSLIDELHVQFVLLITITLQSRWGQCLLLPRLLLLPCPLCLLPRLPRLGVDIHGASENGGSAAVELQQAAPHGPVQTAVISRLDQTRNGLEQLRVVVVTDQQLGIADGAWQQAERSRRPPKKVLQAGLQWCYSGVTVVLQ
jgi:hypothetical protein